MFQQTFVSEASSGRKPVSVAVSLLLQSSFVALLCLAPLLVSQRLPTGELRSLFLGPTPPRPLQKPSTKAIATTVQANVPQVRSFHLSAPVRIPTQISTHAGGPLDAPDIGSVSGSGTGGDPLLSGLGDTGNSVPPPLPNRQSEIHEHTRVVTVGGNVASANLIRRVEPSYPPLAKAARIQGVVVFQAVIGVDGQIRNLQLQEGHPLLVAAARNAIAQWRYRPTLLNGKPVEIATTITVRFSLSQ